MERSLWLDFQERIAGVRVRLSEEAYLGARYDDTELYWTRTGLSIAGALPILNSRNGLAVSFSTAVVTPLADGSTNFLDLPGASDDPLDPLLDSSLGLGGQLDIGRGFGLALYARLSARHEIGAELASALTGGGSFAVDYRRGGWLRLRLGVGLGTAIDRAKLRASPVFRLRIRPIPRVWIETDITSGRIEWEVSSRLELSVFGGVDSTRYRLAERGGTVGSGSLELRKSEVGIGIRTRFGRTFRLGIEAAVVLGQHLTVSDDNRRTVDARDTREPSAALRISFEWRAPRPIESQRNALQQIRHSPSSRRHSAASGRSADDWPRRNPYRHSSSFQQRASAS
jgi:hypothetical protein